MRVRKRADRGIYLQTVLLVLSRRSLAVCKQPAARRQTTSANLQLAPWPAGEGKSFRGWLAVFVAQLINSTRPRSMSSSLSILGGTMTHRKSQDVCLPLRHRLAMRRKLLRRTLKGSTLGSSRTITRRFAMKVRRGRIERACSRG